MSALPKGWVEATLGDVLEPRSEKADPSTVPDLPFLGLEDVEPYSGRVIGYGSTADMKSSVALFSNGDLLFGRLRPYLQKILIADCDGAASAEFIVMKANQYSHLGFFSALLRSDKFLEYTALVSSGDRPRVSYESIADFNLALPPLAEQKRIVAKLDALNAKSARARTELARIETLVARYKQAVLSKAFSGELTREWRQQAPLIVETTAAIQAKSNTGSGRVAKVGAPIQEQRDLIWNCPSSWRWDQVGNCTFVTKLAGFEYTKHVVYDPDGDLRVIKAENAGPDGFRQTAFSRIDSKSVSMLSRSKLVGGELLVVFVGSGTGNVAVVPNDEEYFLGPNIGMARPDPEKVCSEYLEKFFRSNGGKALLLAATKAVAQPSLSMGAIRATPVALPPLEEQHEIVRRIESAFAKIDRLAKEAKRAHELVGRLDEAILAKAFRGELVPQDENDEPASSLLDRIREARTSETSRPKRRASATKGKVHDMARTMIEALAEAKDWLAAQELFASCGVRDGSSTEDVEKLYRQLLDLERQDRVELEEVSDPLTGAKLGNRVRLRK